MTRASRYASVLCWHAHPLLSLQAAFEDGLREMRDEANTYAAESRRRAQAAARAGRRAPSLDVEHSASLTSRAQRAPPGSALALTFVARAGLLASTMQAAESNRFSEG